MPAGWTASTDTGYSISFVDGHAVFSRNGSAGTGFARLTYNTSVGGDFLSVTVIPGDYSLPDGGSMALVAYVGGGFFDAYVRNSGGSIQGASYTSLSDPPGNNPWTPWSGDAVLVIFRAGDTVQAGIMPGIPFVGPTPDLSGFVPLGSWTGDQYLGNATFELSFGQETGPTGTASARADIFVLVTPPYAPDLIPPPGAEAVPEPATVGLVAAGLAALLWTRRRG